MQPLNNDMDPLMRHAAENYSLQPTGLNWQQVADRLDGEEPALPRGAALQNSRRYGLLLLFLLTSLVCNKYLHLGFRLSQFRTNVSSVISTPVKANVSLQKAATEKQNSNLPATVVATTSKKENISKPFYPVDKKKAVTPDYAAAAIPIHKEEPLLQYQTAALAKRERNNHFDLRIKMFKNPFEGVDFERREDKDENNRSNNLKRWYAGVVAGPDVTTVKFSEVENAGFSAGVVLGYNINKKWSVETGLLWDRKSYYADGKDFNTSKLQLPNHSTIIHAEGYCNMFEIPINVRYRFKPKGRHNWFASAGTSSYLMQKEAYDYLYERYNVQYYRNKYYNSSLQHWLAVANISAGYERTWGRGGTIRVEPYLKVPLKGLGTGKLPLTSAGVQVGITHPIR